MLYFLDRHYRSSRNEAPIRYNVLRIPNGIRIDVDLPEKVSPVDKKKVAVWLYDYRSQVRRTHPLWITAFRVKRSGAKTTGYFLDISPSPIESRRAPKEQQLELALSAG